MIIYECFDYMVEEIPYNYRATIKCARKVREHHRKIDRDYYSSPEHGLEHIKELVEHQILLFFETGVSKEENIGASHILGHRFSPKN